MDKTRQQILISEEVWQMLRDYVSRNTAPGAKVTISGTVETAIRYFLKAERLKRGKEK